MAAKAENKDQQRILTPEFRVSYPHIFKPNAIKGNKPKYSVTMLFPKDSDIGVLKEAIKQAKIAKWGSKESWPANLRGCVEDGDNPKYADKEGYKGHWVIKASTGEDQKPGLVDANVEPILEQSKFYAGCYARAYIYVYGWDNEFGKGVSCILDHVQKLRDGKSFGGKKPADQVFNPVNAGSDMSGDNDDDDFTS